MPAFVYVARDPRGRRMRGKIEAPTLREAAGKLRDQRLIVLDVREQRVSALDREIYLAPPVQGKEFVFFTRQLATLIRAGVPIIRALTLLYEQTANRRFRRVLAAVAEALGSGQTFATALGEHPAFFPRFFVAMVRAGEVSGQLDETLLAAADFYERQLSTREEIKSALTYPVIVASSPSRRPLHVDVCHPALYRPVRGSVPLPAITVWTLTVSEALMRFWYAWLGVGLFVLAGAAAWIRTEEGKRFFDALRLRLPIFGPLAQKGAMALFARTMATFYASAVPMMEALTIAGEVAQNRAVAHDLEQAKAALRDGQSFSRALGGRKTVPPIVVQMVAVGEETGSLDDVLGKISDFYEMEVRHTVARLKSLIEPLLIAGLAAVVGVIMLSILLPMLTLYQNLR
ncbi:MAG: type II secretion system F family protein [Hydrogenibacillus sp.]|nr:type II secretion system F family protein [Hydrogenibacillus sp.]